MNQWHEEYGPEGLKIIAVSQQTALGPLEDTIADLGIEYAVAEDSDRDTWEAYGMRVHPSWAFINADGELVDRSPGKVVIDRVEELIEQHVAAGA